MPRDNRLGSESRATAAHSRQSGRTRAVKTQALELTTPKKWACRRHRSIGSSKRITASPLMRFRSEGKCCGFAAQLFSGSQCLPGLYSSFSFWILRGFWSAAFSPAALRQPPTHHRAPAKKCVAGGLGSSSAPTTSPWPCIKPATRPPCASIRAAAVWGPVPQPR